MRSFRMLAAAITALSGCAGSPGVARRPVPAPVSAFSWPGTYDLVGAFPEGERRAVMQVVPSGTGYALGLTQGPPGSLVEMRIAGSEVSITWEMGGELMLVDLAGKGDSLTGTWMIGSATGPVRGARRPERSE